MTTLIVYYRETPCGTLTEDQSGRLEFRYREAWSARPRTPVSIRLPVGDEVYAHDQVLPLVANLLPEGGDLRTLLERLLHVDADHDFGLLAALGRECAGVLSFWPEDESPAELEAGYRPLDIDEFHDWREFAYRRPFQFEGDTVRLSLAGVQSKTALYFDADDAPHVPVNGAATTHILKPRVPGCAPSTVFVELASMRLARAVLGAEEVPATDIWKNCFRIRRFDRPRLSGEVQRKHQEDFCLALGRMPAAKYESISPREHLLKACFELIDRLGEEGWIMAPVLERQRLLNQVILNALMHNPDAHLKNYALLYEQDATLRMAPMYDALCTYGLRLSEDEHGWAQERLPVAHTAQLSMRIGEAVRIDQLTAEDWRQFARECGFGAAFVQRRVRELAGALLEALPVVSQEILDEHPQAESAVAAVARGVRSQATGLDHHG